MIIKRYSFVGNPKKALFSVLTICFIVSVYIFTNILNNNKRHTINNMGLMIYSIAEESSWSNGKYYSSVYSQNVDKNLYLMMNIFKDANVNDLYKDINIELFNISTPVIISYFGNKAVYEYSYEVGYNFYYSTDSNILRKLCKVELEKSRDGTWIIVNYNEDNSNGILNDYNRNDLIYQTYCIIQSSTWSGGEFEDSEYKEQVDIEIYKDMNCFRPNSIIYDNINVEDFSIRNFEITYSDDNYAVISYEYECWYSDLKKQKYGKGRTAKCYVKWKQSDNNYWSICDFFEPVSNEEEYTFTR